MIESDLLITFISNMETCSMLTKDTVYPAALRKAWFLFSKFKGIISAKSTQCGLPISVTPTRRLIQEVDFLDGVNYWVELKTLRVKTKELNMNL